MATEIRWLGHAGIQLTTGDGKTILIDPWLTGNPSAPYPPADQKACDLLLLTHAHGDHVGDTLALAKRFQMPVVTIFDFTHWLSKDGVENLIGINKGGSVEAAGVTVTGTHAFHSSSYETLSGELVYAGEPMGYVIKTSDGFTLYHAGDTALFGDMRLIGELYTPSVAILPVGDHFTMGPRDAAYAAKLLGARTVLPVHWGTFPLLTGTPAQVAECLSRTGIEVVAWSPGQAVMF